VNGKLVSLIIVASAVIVGAAIYYMQVYAYYGPVTLTDAPGGTRIRMTRRDGKVDTMKATQFQGIDANSSPIRFRACFHLAMPLARLRKTYVIDKPADPLIAPGWFSCFRARAIGEALIAGKATAFLGEKNIHPGVDRVIAVFPDGRAYAWQQLNKQSSK